MLLDKKLIFCENQAETTVGDHPSTTIVDQDTAGDAIDKELWVEVLITESFASATGGTAQFKLQTDDNADFTSPKDLLATAAIPAANLPKGAKPILARLPLGCERYLRVLLTIGTGAMTAGKFSAFLTPLPQTNR